ncbi:MAG: RagB/SusD family nutrient uptake outer membrane protein [Gemmatimonadetes bacterium]|nr:RagB/SusD family nutrient uptake outer membrane protein [Gemmatimonadota bacterium]
MNSTHGTSSSRRGWRGVAVAALALAAAGCDLDLVNPNGPLEEEVLSDAELLLTTVAGLQSQFADNFLVFVRAPQLVTDQWSTRPAALAADVSLVRGTPDPTFGVVADPFAATFRISRSAQLVRQSSAQIAGISRAQRTGISALSQLLEAMALGYLTQQYERMPVRFDSAGARPVSREDARDTVIALLERARADVGTLTAAELGAFRARVLDTSAGANSGLNLPNTINAMLARYYLFDGRYSQALEAAGRVPLTAPLSLFQFPATQINPLFQYMSLGQLRYVGARKEFFTDAQAGDARPTFWADRAPSAANSTAGTPDSAFSFRAYGGSRNDPIPVYLPDEMRLIQAEAHARLGNLPAAATLINQVRSQGRSTSGECTTSATEPVGCLAPLAAQELDTPAEVFAQILYERRYELFNLGLRWDDLRRLRAFTSERPSTEFLPFPQSECDRNPNAGC